MQKGDIVPVLLGADLNCYSLARAFHEAYGVKSYAFGKYALGVTKKSRMIEFRAVPDLDRADVCLRVLRDFAEARKEETLLVMGCTDEYAEFLIDHREELEDLYLVPYMKKELKDGLIDKADFYEGCEKFGIPYPKTAIFSGVPALDALSKDSLGFSYPLIVKPSSSIEYWRHPFTGMQKVYVADSPEKAHEIIETIYASGYDRRMIVQKMIPGGDAHMRVLTVYSDKNCQVKMMCMGHVLLEEHTPKGRGNHAAIIVEPLPEVLREKIKSMLETLGVRGFTNFDLKEDEDGTLKAFEINLRQGRSNHYLTASGINPARLVTEDYVFNRELNAPEPTPVFWYSVPKKVVYRYCEDEALVLRAKKLAKEGKSATPLKYRYDLRGNLWRRIFVFETLRRHHKKYKTYCQRAR